MLVDEIESLIQRFGMRAVVEELAYNTIRTRLRIQDAATGEETGYLKVLTDNFLHTLKDYDERYQDD